MRYSSVQYARALYELTKEASSAKRPATIREFLGTVAKNGALSLLPEIMREFEVLFDKKAGIHRVAVGAPERLSERGVARKLRFKAKVRAERDMGLVGGAVVEVDGLRVDNSIKMRLERARKALVG